MDQKMRADVFLRVLPIADMGWIHFIARIENGSLVVLDWGTAATEAEAIEDVRASLIEHARPGEVTSFAICNPSIPLPPLDGVEPTYRID